MDIETRMNLIKKVGEEIITEEELRTLLETKEHPIAYDGFEPSGLAGIHFGLYRAINVEDMLNAGVHFKLYLADWFAWINNKMGGDLEKIKQVGNYFIEVWKASGIDTKKIDVIWNSDVVKDPEYWKKVVLISKNTNVNRATRCLSIMGRKETDLKEVSFFFYPMMQCADIFWLKADICQLGMDQRRVNMLSREIGPKLGWWKPVVVSHHMLIGLQGVKAPEGFDNNADIDIEISSKMSKSMPETCLYVHDSREDIFRKIQKAYCPEKIVKDNPILEYAKYIIFRKLSTFNLTRKKEFGGDLELEAYEELEDLYTQGKIHPLDLKNSVAEALDVLIKPIREHFEKNKRAKELYDVVRKSEITR